jgi:hypothetical protein
MSPRTRPCRPSPCPIARRLGGPPRSIRACHTMRPCPSGSSAKTSPDFWPMVKSRLPSSRAMRLADAPRSKSGPCGSGQFALSAARQAMFPMSPRSNRPDDGAGIEREREDRVAGIGSRGQMIVARANVKNPPLRVDRRRRPDRDAGRSPKLRADAICDPQGSPPGW